ncbi:hypothetical protein C0993_010185 [Termitomyces sp. T159_Od127]|nr:hypothetical protein C0993_010185 [Termitomyces sp. T159_Od127]
MRQILTGERRTSWQKTQSSLKALALVSEPSVVLMSLSHGSLNPLIHEAVTKKYPYPSEMTRIHFLVFLYTSIWQELIPTVTGLGAPMWWVLKMVKSGEDTDELCGFGFTFDWFAPPIVPNGKISVQEALRVLVDSYVISLLVPKWLQYLPLPGFVKHNHNIPYADNTSSSFTKVRQASKTFLAFMKHEIAVRAKEVRAGCEFAEEHADAFTMLVRANEQETGKLRLSDEEVVQTTAHALSATLALLALHETTQDEIFEHVVSVVGYDRDPVYNDHEKLNKVRATFYEALRLFREASSYLVTDLSLLQAPSAAAYLMFRELTEDTVLNLPKPIGEEGSTPLVLLKGTAVVLDIIGIHYNPRYFDNPEEFRPSRWYNTDSESEAFSAFGIGPRACLGRKFAIVEATAFLTMLLRDWHVTPIFKVGETSEAWRERVLSKPVMGLTLGIRGAPVRLTRRQTRM